MAAATIALSLALAACGGAQPAPRPSASASVKPAPAPRAAPGHLARGDVDRVLAFGPPWLLRRVQMEDVARDGKFVGWRLIALPEEWKSLDLKPGDVVTKVNGVVVEKPDDLWTVWTALAKASELKVSYERDGAPRELTLPIDGAPGKGATIGQAGPPPPRPASKPKGTIVIEEDTSTGPSE